MFGTKHPKHPRKLRYTTLGLPVAKMWLISAVTALIGPVTLTFIPFTSKWEHGSPVILASVLLIFILSRPSFLDIGVRHGTDRQTDDKQTVAVNA